MRFSLIAAALLAPAALAAQGRLIPMCNIPADGPRGVIPCQAQIVRTRSDVRGELVGRVVRYTVSEEFVNQGGRLGEADYLFPLPPGAAFRDLKLSFTEKAITELLAIRAPCDAAHNAGAIRVLQRARGQECLRCWSGGCAKAPRPIEPPPSEARALQPGYIGGHCVMPNIGLLRRRFQSEFLEVMKRSNEARKAELAAQEQQDSSERLKPLALA